MGDTLAKLKVILEASTASYKKEMKEAQKVSKNVSDSVQAETSKIKQAINAGNVTEPVKKQLSMMQKLKRSGGYSIHCIRAMDYIQTHLHEAIRLKDIASYVKLEPTYLSRLFKQETGDGISDYITKEKVKVAKSMLEYSDYSCTEIAEYLAYSSDSYFGKIFRRETMQTPREYRRSHYRKHWMAEKS